MIEQIGKLGVMGFTAIALVATAVFVVVYSTVNGETETSKLFAAALSGPAIGGVLVAAGGYFATKGSPPSGGALA